MVPVTFCNIFYITFIAEASSIELVTVQKADMWGNSSERFADTKKETFDTSQRPGETYCVNFQVGVPGSLSTIFSF